VCLFPLTWPHLAPQKFGRIRFRARAARQQLARTALPFETPAHVMSSQKPRAQSPSSHASGSDRSRGPRQRGAHGRRPPSPQRLPEHAHAKPRLPPRVPAQPSSATAGATASPISGGTSQRVAAPRAAPKGERRSPATAIARDEPQQAHANSNPNPNPNPILTRTLTLTESSAAERSRPRRYLAYLVLTLLTRRTRPRRRWPAAARPLIIPPWAAEARPRSTRPRQGGMISGQRKTRASCHSESGG